MAFVDLADSAPPSNLLLKLGCFNTGISLGNTSSALDLDNKLLVPGLAGVSPKKSSETLLV